MAMQYLEYTMTNRLKIVWNLDPPMRDIEIGIELSRGVYSWSYEKFLARRRFKHVWIDLLMWEFGEALLERVKLHFDLNEVSRLVDVIFKAMYALVDGKSIDFDKYLWGPFIDVQRYLTVAEDLCAEVHANKTKEFEYVNFLMVAWGPAVLPVINETNERLFDAIEIRYQLNWYRSKVNQMQLKSDILQESYVKSTSQALQASKTEEDVGFNIVDVIYNETQRFRDLIIHFQKLYDVELEKIETSIRVNKKQITKLVDHQKFLSEQIVRFAEEIAARKALEIKRFERATVVYQLVEMARIRRDDTPAEGDSAKIDFSEFANKIMDEFKKTLNNEDLQVFVA
uniref:Uncharacterized protein n=1 Tax=Glossina morsitans morsitans TaxID=37546 RepID=A0A1B0FGU3_GLOMM